MKKKSVKKSVMRKKRSVKVKNQKGGVDQCKRLSSIVNGLYKLLGQTEESPIPVFDAMDELIHCSQTHNNKTDYETIIALISEMKWFYEQKFGFKLQKSICFRKL